MWGEIPVIGLDTRYWKYTQQFLKLVESFPSENFEYFTFPKAALMNKIDTTVILSKDFQYLDSKHVAQNLLDRNPGVLKGRLRAIKQKTFPSKEQDRNGHNMGGFRLIQLEGSP